MLLSGDINTKQSPQFKKSKGLPALLRELSDDEDMTDAGPKELEDPNWTWQRDFCAYLDVFKQVLDSWTAITWWGVSVLLDIAETSQPVSQFNAQRYHPAWTSLARDYLSIITLSVSSEWAFSQGGITISKRRNWLKGDIVKALQCVKCAIRHNLLFREPAPSSITEAELNEDEEHYNEDDGEQLEIDEKGWDELIIEDEDDGHAVGMDTGSD
jgi:hypothetical protein